MKLRKRHLLEILIYAALWLVVFLLPVLGNYLSIYSGRESSYNWDMVSHFWLTIVPFLLIFAANNYLLAPYLLFRKRYMAYALSVICIVVVILWVSSLTSSRDEFREEEGRGPEHVERTWQRISPNVENEERGRPDKPGRPDKLGKQPGKPGKPGKPDDGDYPPDKSLKRNFLLFPGMMMAPFYGRFLIAILVVGFNIAVKLLFKSLRDEETMKELERHNLQTELEYLKYQINPHFFMNTLNNIHALVDIDAEKAKMTIVELSKMMRYVLYESSNKTILLSREIRFLNNYIGLMKLRYTEKVNIEVSMPVDFPDVQIPPLLFISFVENAFKHGVSYQSDSFIHVCMKLEGEQLLFQCSNSHSNKRDDQEGGIGLENIRKRLRLLFGENYVLSIDQVADSFNVLLIIPII